MSTEVAVSDIINVSVVPAQVGLSNLSVNSIAIFTGEDKNSSFGSAAFKIYYSPSAVAVDFGTSSETYKQAVEIFSQNPNILTAGGYLVVIPLLTLGADTSGSMQTLVPGPLAGFVAITDGSFVVSIDGSAKTLTSLDFHSCTTMADVAAVIDTALSTDAACAYSATANDGEGAFIITSAAVGATSAVSALSAHTSGTDISNSAYLNGNGNVRIIAGKASGGTEDIIAAMVRVANTVFYVGVLTAETLAAIDISNLGVYAQATDKIVVLGASGTGTWQAIALDAVTRSLTNLRILPYFVGASEASQYAAGYLSRLMGTNFTGDNTMSTMHLKSISGVVADPSSADSTILYYADLYGCDLYVSYAGDACVRCPKSAPLGYADQVFARIWLKYALQIAGYNFLRTTATKIPQTEAGMSGLKGAYAGVMAQAVRCGYLGTGLTWTSSTTFGNPADLYRNITDVGYYIYSLPIALQSTADRNDRKAPLVQIAAKEAGAIHRSDVIVAVN